MAGRLTGGEGLGMEAGTRWSQGGRKRKKVKERESRLKYEYIGKTEDLMIVGISDTSLKTGKKAVGGVFLFLTNSLMTRASPLYWNRRRSILCVTALKTQRQ